MKMKLSGCSNLKDRELEYLDRQEFECGSGQALNAFSLLPPDSNGCSKDDMQYMYMCTEGTSITGVGIPDHNTPCTHMNQMGVYYLDRQQDIKCPTSDNSQQAISGFKMNSDDGKCGSGNQRYTVNCAEFKQCANTEDLIGRTHCQETKTWAFNVFGKNDRVRFLDRHYVACGVGDVMRHQQLHGQRGSGDASTWTTKGTPSKAIPTCPSNQIQFEYTCSPVCAAPYWKSAPGGATCKSGYGTITDSTHCKAALQATKDHTRTPTTGTYPNHPKGCFVVSAVGSDASELFLNAPNAGTTKTFTYADSSVLCYLI